MPAKRTFGVFVKYGHWMWISEDDRTLSARDRDRVVMALHAAVCVCGLLVRWSHLEVERAAMRYIIKCSQYT